MKAGIRATVCLAFILEFAGVWFSAQGVVRESFVELSRETGGFSFRHQPAGHEPTGRQPSFDPDAFDPDSFAGMPSAIDRFLVGAGLKLGLLPSERELTAKYRRENARSAVLGVSLVLAGMLLDAAVKGRRLLFRAANCIRDLTSMVGQWLKAATSRLKAIIFRR